MDIKNSNQKKELWLKIVVLVLSLILFLQITLNPGLDNCQKCRFDYNGKEITTAQLIDKYAVTCFSNVVGYKDPLEKIISDQSSSASTNSLDSSEAN